MSRAALTPALERIRRRAGATGAIAIAVPATGLAWGLADLTRVLLTPGPPARLAVTLPLAVVTAILAATIAWIRRPDLAAVARATDRRLGLQASVVTAWQFHDATDAFAVRTEARAIAGLRDAPAADVYPWRISRPGVGALTLGAVLALASAVVPDSGTASRRAAPTASTGSAPTGDAQPGTPGATRVSRGSAASPAAAAMPPPAPSAAPTPAAANDAAKPNAAPPSTESDAGNQAALTSVAGPAGRRSAAPGGGRSGGSGAMGSGRPSTVGGAATSRAQAGEATRMPGLERVPMNRRAYVRRYLLPGAEPR